MDRIPVLPPPVAPGDSVAYKRLYTKVYNKSVTPSAPAKPPRPACALKVRRVATRTRGVSMVHGRNAPGVCPAAERLLSLSVHSPLIPAAGLSSARCVDAARQTVTERGTRAGRNPQEYRAVRPDIEPNGAWHGSCCNVLPMPARFDGAFPIPRRPRAGAHRAGSRSHRLRTPCIIMKEGIFNDAPGFTV